MIARLAEQVYINYHQRLVILEEGDKEDRNLEGEIKRTTQKITIYFWHIHTMRSMVLDTEKFKERNKAD